MKILTILLIILLSLNLVSCLTASNISSISGISETELKSIPIGAKSIEVEGIDSSGTEMYEEALTALISRGHRIQREDKGRLYIFTEGKDIGEATMQRMTISISKIDGKVIMKLKSEWNAGSAAVNMATAMSGMTATSDWIEATYQVGRPGIAFAEGLTIAKSIKGVKIRYFK